jgi:urease accessory protein
MRGMARLAFRREGDDTVLATLSQTAPLRVFVQDDGGGLPSAVLVTTSGGLVGGDRLGVEATLGAGTRATIVAQAAEKIYRSLGPDAVVTADLRVEAEARLEYLPQETILFDGARLRRETRIDAAPTATVMAGEILVFGRRARGERFAGGALRDAWSVRRGGRLVWADALVLEDDLAAAIDHPAGLGGAAACATLILVGHVAPRRLAHLRLVLAGSGGAATLVNGVLVARWLSPDPLALRRAFAKAWRALREADGLPGRMPRLWNI